jgi:PAS domain S-box-containing protein
MSIKILVVEDEPDLELLISRKFRRRIHAGELQFLFVENGVEALEQLEVNPDVSVVVTDINMPRMDGFTLLAELNERYPLLRTVIISAYGNMENIRMAMNQGAYDFLTKPVDFNDLERTLNKTIRHVQQLIHEVTERKRTEKELLQLKKAVETMQLGVTISDLDGKILYTNLADAQMHGYQVDELLGQDVGIFAPPDSRKPMSLDQIKQWKGSIRESVNIRRDGSTFPVWLMSEIVKDIEGHPTAIVTSCEDIIERKQAEEELKKHRDRLEELIKERTSELTRANQQLQQEISERKQAEDELLVIQNDLQETNAQLQELNASKDKFFSIISHDLRSAFGVLFGFTELLTTRIDVYSKDKLKDLIAKLNTSVERMYALLENLLTWSRIQRGIMKCEPNCIDLFDIVEENMAIFMSRAEYKEVALRSLIQENTLAYADYDMVNTVVRNLISNALKFTDTGGSITVSAVSENQHVEVTVSDTGCGIDEKGIANIFRIDTTYTSIGTAGEQGTGLGLILCKELIEQNGGRIWVESEIGEGTVFRFTVPQKPE